MSSLTPVPDRFNLAGYCLAHAARRPEAIALRVFDAPDGPAAEEWSYATVAEAVQRVAGGLADLDLPRGARVLLRIGNSSDFPLLFFGAIAAGLVPIPTSEQLTAAECDLVLADSGACLVIHDGATALPAPKDDVAVLGPGDIVSLKRARRAGFADTAADDPAFLVYTSGTSGRPKGVLHAQRAAWGRRPMYQGWYGITADDVLFHAGAFNWTYTLGVGLMDPWANGATSVVYAGDRMPQVWPRLLENAGATLFAAVPSLYRRILKYNDITPASFPELRHGLTAGEALRPALHAEWLAASGRPLYEALGMSEISTYVSSGPDVPTRPGSPGRAQSGRRVAVLSADEPDNATPLPANEVGLLCVHRSDPGLMLGYWKRPEDTAAAFRGDWFITGDRASLDDDGYVWYDGRADDVMNSFGYRVAPEEVEKAFAGRADIAEIAVTETEVGGLSLITAFCVPVDGVTPDEAALRAWAAERLADYKRPKRYVMVEALPHTRSGKLLRRALRDTDRA